MDVVLRKENNFTHGFTLIELLVVISIISLLSTVVMANLNQSRVKAQEAAIKQDLLSIKTQAELSYSKTGDYSTISTEIAQILAHINANGGTARFLSSYDVASYLGYKNYAVSTKLNSDPTKIWSVSDIGGVVTWDKVNSPIGSPQNMNWSTAKATCESYGKRLPTVEELKTLYNTSPSFLPSGFYWANTDYQPLWIQNYAYFLGTGNGGLSGDDKDNPHSFRCVR